jgi:hypothetical protein
MASSRKRARADSEDEESAHERRRQNMLDMRMCIEELQAADDGSTIYKLIRGFADADACVAAAVRRAYCRLLVRQEVQIDFDFHIKNVWYEIYRDHSRPRHSGYDATTEVPAFIEKTIETIARKATQHPCYTTKLSALETLRKIGRVLCESQGTEVACAVSEYFRADATLGDAMYNIVATMDEVQVDMLCGEFNGETTFLEDMEALLELEAKMGLEMALGSVLDLMRGEESEQGSDVEISEEDVEDTDEEVDEDNEDEGEDGEDDEDENEDEDEDEGADEEEDSEDQDGYEEHRWRFGRKPVVVAGVTFPGCSHGCVENARNTTRKRRHSQVESEASPTLRRTAAWLRSFF